MLVIPSFLHAQFIASEFISEDTFWQKEQGPIIISTDLIINPGVTLRVGQGVRVLFENNSYLIVRGSLFIDGMEDDPVIFEGPGHLYSLDGGKSYANHVNFSGVSLGVYRGSLFSAIDSYVNGGDGFIIHESSEASFTGCWIENVFSGFREPLIQVSKNSRVFFENSYIQPIFSSLALVMGNSSLFATSTKMIGMVGGGVDILSNSTIGLYDVIMKDNFADSEIGGSFIYLSASRANISQSQFIGTTMNAFEVYENQGKYSHLLIHDSYLEDFGETGLILGKNANVLINRVRIHGGKIGIENFSTSTQVTDSSFLENTEYGIFTHYGRIVSAVNNFWGDVSGPYHAIKNTSGIGVVVSDGVEFAPWVFEGIQASCCSNVMFLPGLQASRLYRVENVSGVPSEERIWEPVHVGGAFLPRLTFDSDGQSVYPDIYTRDVIDSALAPLPIPGTEIYSSFMSNMDDLVSEGIINTWKAISYDWRFSVEDVVTKASIVKELKDLASTSKTGKVTLVAHSNGGLVVKALFFAMEDYFFDHLVDRIIFVAVPQVGTPQAMGALLHGFNQNIGNGIFMTGRAARDLSKNMPGIYGLLPSSKYVTLGALPLVQFQATSTHDWIRDSLKKFGKSIVSFPDLISFLKGDEGRSVANYGDLASPQILNQKLIESAHKIHDYIDEWIPSPHLDVIQIAGHGVETLRGIRYYEMIKNKKTSLAYEPLLTKEGDGTVILKSALFLSTLTPWAMNYILDLASHNKDRFSFFKKKHHNIFEAEPVRSLLVGILSGDTLAVEPYISTSTPVVSDEPGLQVLLHSADLFLDVFDEDGNHTGISPIVNVIEEQIPGSFYGEFGEVAYISLPKRHSGKKITARVTVRGLPQQNSSFALDIQEVVGGNVGTSISFIDVPVSSTTVAFVEIGGPEIGEPVLQIDTDHNGSVDFEVLPGVVSEISIQSEKLRTDAVQESQKRKLPQTRRLSATVENSPEILIKTDKVHEIEIEPVIIITPTTTRLQSSPTINEGIFGYPQTANIFGAIRRSFSRIRDFLRAVFVYLIY